jgi:hypothetical protein
MLTLLALQLAASVPAAVHNGRAGQTSVAAVRLDETVTVDGRLAEPVWQRAALLTGFSVYQPIDNQPAPDSTEVLVWYSRDAIHFGIRSFEPHGPVSASLAERDHIESDDNVEIHLDSFRERDRALVFIVNPLGVQADGTRSEGGGFIPGANVAPGQNDLSADFQWESKGRLTEWGYEAEVRIPFRSIRYATGATQDWGLQVVRHVQHSGYEETWTPAVRANASFISQAGWLRGLSGMHHGQIVELTPELTNTTVGASSTTAGWRYANAARGGGNVRWALGSNFVLNGTVRPDFSQVEADATQIAADQRFALFYPEKRPFFVESSDQFNVPNTLVYTRRIVQPDAAIKLTGKLGRTDVAALSALDAASPASGGDKPMVDILRLRRAILGESSAGLLYSDRLSTARNNHVAGADTRLLFKRLYYFQGQLAGSSTYDPGAASPDRSLAPMWEAVLDRTGRKFGFHYAILGVDSAFRADNGFVQRVGMVQPSLRNRFTIYGKRGGLFERYNAFAGLIGVWRYGDFFAGRSLLESQANVQNTITLRGGWQLTATPALSSYAFDPGSYASYRLASPADVIPPGFDPFTVPGRTPSFTMSAGISTPQYPLFDASVSAVRGNDVDLIETSRVRRRGATAAINVRPTDRLRVNATYTSSSYVRRASGARSFSSRIPRVKLEYQIARPLFVRVVSQYQATERASLIDPTTGLPIALVGAGGTPELATGSSSNALRTDWLISYRPNPGTVAFLGYGNTLREPEALGFRDLRRVDDAFFVKLSYLFRVAR